MQSMNLENQAIEFSDSVQRKVLVGGTPQSVTVPAGATKVVMSGTADFYAAKNVDAEVPGSEGSPPADPAAALNPTNMRVAAGDTISVISASACNVTFSFYK